MKHLLLIILSLLLIPSGVQALTFLGGDPLVLDTPIPDDVVASGGSVTVKAPVDSLTVAGGTVTVDAPVRGDVIAAGGTLVVNGDVGGKVLAAGGEIELNGNATNALITGGTVRIGEGGVIERDAFISAGEVTNAGSVLGNLSVSAGSFINTGTAGNVTFEEQRSPGLAIPGLFSILVAIGFLILGNLLIWGFPDLFGAVVQQIERSPVILTIVGFVAIIVSAVLLLIVAITIIGLPIALVGGLLFIVAMLLSSLFVAYALGDVIITRTKWRPGRVWVFVLGFVILQILILIPLLGAIVWIIAVSLGYGGILYALRGAYPFRGGGAA
ncbi:MULTISPECIES: hypothetical protein [Methanoculleus]|jgi:hypothetical protein|uniref:DUF8173 domain-containing protein n=1 Tax=Methanoculleus thermophilus TaxID=2200 RepID=A0A1G8Y280_9EURY|nr:MULTISPECIES: hypothetical protein [Methanoculleus]NLN09529.1 hypothetical protein [Methanoculleus thermophilus]SDJ96787.1 hypothetical protein SAMN04488571_102175 [Methanoculleus thermophilus]HQD25751.1 hypothetical protein [Methanoculleus thermophilus]